MANVKSLALKKRLLLNRFPIKPDEDVYIDNPRGGKKIKFYGSKKVVNQSGNGFLSTVLYPVLQVIDNATSEIPIFKILDGAVNTFL